MKNLTASSSAHRQMATAMWLIDVLALRVGGEKDEEEADTVGCCTLRVEHANFSSEGGKMEMHLSFLGKDSMPFNQTVDFRDADPRDATRSASDRVGPKLFKNLQDLCRSKRQEEDIFDSLNPTVRGEGRCYYYCYATTIHSLTSPPSPLPRCSTTT